MIAANKHAFAGERRPGPDILQVSRPMVARLFRCAPPQQHLVADPPGSREISALHGCLPGIVQDFRDVTHPGTTNAAWLWFRRAMTFALPHSRDTRAPFTRPRRALGGALSSQKGIQTLALSIRVFRRLAPRTIGALAAACAGMWAGQALRSRIPPASFQRAFFFGLLLLGAYLALRNVS